MKKLTRDDILGVDDLQRVEVEVPEWGGTVFVRELSALERDTFGADYAGAGDGAGVNPEKLKDFRAKIAAMCIVEETGDQLFSEKDIVGLGKKSSTAMDRVVNKVLEISGMNVTAVDDAKKN